MTSCSPFPLENDETDEDMDFNPFIKESPSSDESSSESSAAEDLENNEDLAESHDISDSKCHTPDNKFINPSLCENKNPRSDCEEEEDAICKRTRAKYSLTNFSLHDLEAFLQETDEEDDICDIDEEEEYRKFLAAVQDADGNDKAIYAEEEEESDADFEVELEELFQSDAEEPNSVVDKKHEERRRPQTRQYRRQKNHSENEKNQLRPLRPLLPILPNLPSSSPPLLTLPNPLNDSEFSNSLISNGYFNGFTPHQIAQLHSLIHEHVQLLLQVFTLTAVDVSRQHIASQVQCMITELSQERDEVVKNKNIVYPEVCFHPSYFSSAASDDMLSSDWLPTVSNPVRTILDVAPLNYCKTYMEEVSTVMRDSRKQQFLSGSEKNDEKEPMFSFPSTSTAPNNSDGQCLNAQQKAKKTLAASIVEQAKKQSIAFVPKDVKKLAEIFVPYFNPALFPHKPPPAVVANRILFTDAEDELLAIGILEYNNDWKAIQQRFLPCKSKHQIFVRQKNRSSSKAPENSIKVIRRMKSSPLTVDEFYRIQEGLRIYKSDWTAVWKFVVPYRDPTLLPRLWRIALGTQRCYKSDPAKKAKRRLYESQRRMKMANVSHLPKENTVTNTDSTIEPYVHRAFLSDWDQEPSLPNTKTKPTLPKPLSQKDQRPLYMTAISSTNNHPTPNTCRLVKLAPGLPPVNLPPSVRVISEPSFRESNPTHPSKIITIRTSHPEKAPSEPEDHGFEMHPLLFKEPSSQPSTSSPSHPLHRFSFFPENLLANHNAGFDLHPFIQTLKEPAKPGHNEGGEIGFVMEREELTDSDDEEEEDVERIVFECEELSDSEEDSYPPIKRTLTENGNKKNAKNTADKTRRPASQKKATNAPPKIRKTRRRG